MKSNLRALSLWFLIAAGLSPPRGEAADLLGIYAGGSVGQSTVKADPLDFSKHDLGWKVLVGIRATLCYFNVDYTRTRFAYGVGTQLKFDRLAVRVEYERIAATNGDPSLLSAGVAWTLW